MDAHFPPWRGVRKWLTFTERMVVPRGTHTGSRMKFIDLFAGLGGFHLAMKRLGHECVFASEIDAGLQALYHQNHGQIPAGDIREISPADIPTHDILCAGFPCQPFSKAGEQEGLRCPDSGDLLFRSVMRIIRHHEPKYILMENVANLERHDGGKTWQNRLRRRLIEAGYDVDARCFSPHQFGIPQIRQRFFIICARSGLAKFKWPTPTNSKPLSIRSVLDRNPTDAGKISAQAVECLEVWQEFLHRHPANQELPGFPIWSMEFGATYPYEDTTPWAHGLKSIRAYHGCHGKSLRVSDDAEILDALPSYARVKDKSFPSWKVAFIRQNRHFYDKHRRWIDRWMPSILKFPQSLQKFEWHCKGEERNIWNSLIQFRASGVRVKRATTAPSLVAMTTTQVPIVGWDRRYMTPRECARLQSMDVAELPFLPTANTRAFKALGNSVNVDVVERVARALLPAFCSANSHRAVRISA
jgi:DNA (cytosine-5)-methyltransferase 1